MLGPIRDETVEGRRNLYNQEFPNFYPSRNIMELIRRSRWMRWAGHVARIEAKMNTSGILVEKPEGMRPLGRPRRKWDDNIKKNLREIGWGYMYWIHLAQNGNK
jgi:hypothetical protein